MEPDLGVLCEADFWRRAWKKARNSSSYVRKRIRNEKEAIEFWNKLAPNYGKHTSGRGRERLEKVIGLLEQEGILTPETEVLDVGCGPGTYALPFAERVKSVTALDGAEEMCRILKEKAKETGLENITVLVRMWEDVDIKKEGLASAFDLVFASMTPAVSDDETLLKLNQASRKYCCLISRAKGKFSSRTLEELWELIFKEKDTGRGHMIIYPFNLLYSLGYYPTMRYLDSCWVQEEPIDQAVESLCRSFWLYTEITPQVKDTIARYVQERAVNGVFRQETQARLGIMTWRVDEQGR
ncbi:MAG: class I SAM-dependent methyltransferase [Desulfotomaculales bacterium]